jgi:hypothetical protein
MLGDAHLAPGTRQQLVALGAALFRPWLGAIGPMWQEVLSDGQKQLVEERRLPAGSRGERVQGVRKMVQAVERAFEGKPREADVMVTDGSAGLTTPKGLGKLRRSCKNLMGAPWITASVSTLESWRCAG